MKVAVMQPYFLPYIGYFQLLNLVDAFVVYDNIQFSKKGWIHRNRLLFNKKDEFVSLSLKKDSDYKDVRERTLSESWKQDKVKTIRKIEENYKKSPFYEKVKPLVEEIFNFNNNNLFDFIIHSLTTINHYLQISTPVIVSSTLEIDHTLRGQDKVLAICKLMSATHYINPIGGLELYDNESFLNQGIELSFLKSINFTYSQLDNEFIPWLSIIDIMMFNDIETIKKQLDLFTLVKNNTNE